MNRTYKYMVNVFFYNSPFHQEFFIDEKSAKEYANRMTHKADAKSVELLNHRRYGYYRMKLIVRHHEGAQIWTDKDSGKQYTITATMA